MPYEVVRLRKTPGGMTSTVVFASMDRRRVETWARTPHPMRMPGRAWIQHSDRPARLDRRGTR